MPLKFPFIARKFKRKCVCVLFRKKYFWNLPNLVASSWHGAKREHIVQTQISFGRASGTLSLFDSSNLYHHRETSPRGSKPGPDWVSVDSWSTGVLPISFSIEGALCIQFHAKPVMGGFFFFNFLARLAFLEKAGWVSGWARSPKSACQKTKR